MGEHLDVRALTNLAGNLLAGTSLELHAGSIDNQHGVIAATNGDSSLKAEGQIDNEGGDIESGQRLTLDAGSVKNSHGQLLAGDAMQIATRKLDNTGGLIQASDALDINTHGGALINANTLTETGGIRAGGALTLSAGNVDNHNGLLSGDTFTGQGLAWNNLAGEIDGGDVLLRTDTLHNTGTGRLYGDRLAIDARALLNDQSGEMAATIAARDHLAIATDRLSNQDHGLIYSNGGLSIGGKLDDAGKLTGQASQVENLSATIEAMGDLRIGAAKMENRDIHLTVSPDLKTVSVTPNVLDVELCTGERWTEGCGRTDGQHYSFKGSLVEFNKDENSPVAFDFDQDGRSYALDEQGNRITVDVDGKPQYIYLWQDSDKDIIRYNLPGVSDDGRRFDIFSYTQSVKEQQVSGQDSAVIRSGGDLALNGDLHNKDSQVVAGQDLLINGSVDNDETTVRQEITKDGVVVRVGKRKSHEQTHFEGQGDYQAPVQETDLPLYLTVQQQGQGAGEGRTIAQQQSTSGAGGQASGLNGTEALAQLGQQALVSEVPLPSDPPGNMQLKPVSDALSEGSGATDLQRQKTAGGMTNASLNTGSAHDGTQNDGEHSGPPVVVPPQDNWVLRSVTGPVKLPNNSLFSLHPGSDSHYLVETDRRFTDGKQALSSGDFYSQDQLQKRLGDGYYEQSLVRDQVMKATGQRYLSGFSDDESQYRALLSSGKSFTERFTISPGADLSADQMAQVTSDMVLMVNQTVTLPDGSTQVVSVPKLYARVLRGDLQGDGSLLAGNNLNLMSGEEIWDQSSRAKWTKHHFLSKTTLKIQSEAHQQNALSSTVSGDRLKVMAGNDLTASGSNMLGTHDVNLSAGRNLTLGLSGTVGSALNTAVHQVKVAKKEENCRLAALTGYQAAQLAAEGRGNSSDDNIAGLTLSNAARFPGSNGGDTEGRSVITQKQTDKELTPLTIRRCQLERI